MNLRGIICKIRGRHAYSDDIRTHKHREPTQWYMHYNKVCVICEDTIYVDIYVTNDDGVTWRVLPNVKNTMELKHEHWAFTYGVLFTNDYFIHIQQNLELLHIEEGVTLDELKEQIAYISKALEDGRSFCFKCTPAIEFSSPIEARKHDFAEHYDYALYQCGGDKQMLLDSIKEPDGVVKGVPKDWSWNSLK